MTRDDGSAEMTSALEDERLRFFLENRDLILMWAALGDEVSDAADDELRRLGGLVQEMASEAGVDLAVAERVAGDSWQAPMLHRSSWMTPGADGPDIAIGIGWDGRRVQPTPGRGTSLPYVGVLASHTTERGRAIEAAVRPLMERGLIAPRTYQRARQWIVYRPIQAPDDWYTDLPGWRAWVVEQLLRTWRDCADLIDEGVAT
jgi:hypothetical protein